MMNWRKKSSKLQKMRELYDSDAANNKKKDE